MKRMMRIHIYKRWCCVIFAWFLSLVVGCNKALDNECKQKVVWYQDKLWKSNVRIFGKCAFDKTFLKSHEKIAKYLKKYTEPFGVIDNIVWQFPLKDIKSHQNKGWDSIPKEVKSKICEIANKIKGVTIWSIMPCVIKNKSSHLLSVHGENIKRLVKKIPRNVLFKLDNCLLDYSSCTLFACQEEMYFVVGQQNTYYDEQLNQYEQFPFQYKNGFESNEHQCILDAFMKMCCEILSLSGQDTLMKYFQKGKKHCTSQFDITKMLSDSRCGIFKKEQYFVNDSTDAKSWIMDHAYTEQPFLVAIRGKMNTMSHCIGILQNMIVDATLMDGQVELQ